LNACVLIACVFYLPPASPPPHFQLSQKKFRRDSGAWKVTAFREKASAKMTRAAKGQKKMLHEQARRRSSEI
jgi:hypothetical protein